MAAFFTWTTESLKIVTICFNQLSLKSSQWQKTYGIDILIHWSCHNVFTSDLFTMALIVTNVLSRHNSQGLQNIQTFLTKQWLISDTGIY